MKRRIILGLAALLAAACAPPASDIAATGEAADIPAVESAAPSVETALAVSAIPIGRYSAIANTSVSITGDLTLGDSTLTFTRDQTYETQRVGTADASQPYAAGGETFAAALGIPATTGLEIRRVTVSRIGAGARNGGVCGRDTVTFTALAAATDASGMPALWIAAFKGAQPPGPNAQPTDLCGIFTYSPASL